MADFLQEPNHLGPIHFPFVPSRAVTFGELHFFQANDGLHGRELWRSDGTREGTAMLRDICPGICSATPGSFGLVEANGLLFFSAWDGERGMELWATDGTAEGTRLVHDVAPGPESANPALLASLGDAVVFPAWDPARERELWVSDGTRDGTEPVTSLDASARVSAPVAVGSVAYFGVGSASGIGQLWVTDGTAAGTREVFDFGEGALLAAETDIEHVHWSSLQGDLLVFAAHDGSGFSTWRSDGTTEGTFAVDAAQETASSQFTEALGRVFFNAGDATLWVTDGSVEGTIALTQADQVGDRGCNPWRLTATSTKLLFVCGDAGTGNELFASDGTPEGTGLVKDIVPGTASSLLSTTALIWGGDFLAWPSLGNGALFFADEGEAGISPWFSDGTTVGTVRLLPSGTVESFGVLNQIGASHPGETVFWAGSLLQPTLYKTDGTPEGTVSLGPMHHVTSSFAGDLFDFGGERAYVGAWFVGSSETERRHWVVDGSELFPGDSVFPPFDRTRPLLSAPIAAGGRVFIESPESGLYSTAPDLSDLQQVSQDSGLGLTLFDSAASGQLLVRAQPSVSGEPSVLETTDPITSASTFLSGPEVPTFPVDGMNAFTLGGGRLFLPSLGGLWSVDGNASLLNSESTVTESDSFARLDGGQVALTASTEAGGREPWAVDPETGLATELPVQAGPGSGAYRVGQRVRWTQLDEAFRSSEAWEPPETYAGLGDLYLFAGEDGTSGVELWATTAEGPPFLVRDIVTGSGSSFPQALQAAAGFVFFRANDGVHGSELWVTDGTEQGTVMLRDIRAGAESSLPTDLTAVDGSLLFSAWDDEHGRELWISDGTPAGTVLRHEIAPGPLPSSPTEFLVQDGRVLFAANDGTGFELWAIDRPVSKSFGEIFRTGFESGNTSSWTQAND
ncbi:MAG: ELWxxDGT repeat protein [Acidobacteriota bacterium]